jgi:hypothetical protein
VNVVPMDRERVLSHQTVLVEGGRITALGPGDKVQVPAGAVRVDGRGKYLIPGLADMHAHLGTREIERHMFSYVAHGITTVREIDPVEDERMMSLKAPAVRPRLYFSASITPPAREARLKSAGLDSIAARVAASKAAGYDIISLRADYPREDRVFFDSLAVIARRLGLPLASHTNSESFDGMLVLGAYGGSVEHLYAFRDVIAQPAADVSALEVQALADATRRAGAWITVTLDCTEQRQYPMGSDIKVARQMVKALQDAGAGLLLGADADNAHGLSPSVVHEELMEMVRAGLTPYQALLTGTRNVAQYFGKLDSSGTVAVGKWADLVLLSGHPLADIRHTLEPAGVMRAGRWFDRPELDQGLLTSPKAWFGEEIPGSIMPQIVDEQKEIKEHYGKFEALLDSLGPRPQGRDASYEHVLRSLADELGAMRGILTPAQRETFDPQARVWMREQARQGYPVTVPGVASAP